MLPFSIFLFFLGLSWIDGTPSQTHRQNQAVSRKHLITLLWGCTGTALAFFLASFQVHEKSILLAMAPASLLIMEFPAFITWFSLVAMWSMWNLIHLDRLSIAYVTCGILFVVGMVPYLLDDAQNRTKEMLGKWFGSYPRVSERILNVSFGLCYVLMILFHVAEWTMTPPAHMPDLFPVIWSMSGCCMFGISWLLSLIYCYQSWREAVRLEDREKVD
jgi:alpha-1,3-glucosyltransferase